VAARFQISFINRTDRLNHDRRIRGIGGVNRDGARWTISEEGAIAAIEAGDWSFYVDHGGHDLAVIVAVSKYGSKYLKSVEDGLNPDSLLALPECR